MNIDILLEVHESMPTMQWLQWPINTLQWSKEKLLFTTYVDDQQSQSPWPMMPAPSYEIDIPMVQMIKMDLKNSNLAMQEGKRDQVKKVTLFFTNIDRLKDAMKHSRGLQLLICTRYKSYHRLGGNNDGLMKPLSLPSQKSKKGLSYIW